MLSGGLFALFAMLYFLETEDNFVWRLRSVVSVGDVDGVSRLIKPDSKDLSGVFPNAHYQLQVTTE